MASILVASGRFGDLAIRRLAHQGERQIPRIARTTASGNHDACNDNAGGASGSLPVCCVQAHATSSFEARLDPAMRRWSVQTTCGRPTTASRTPLFVTRSSGHTFTNLTRLIAPILTMASIRTVSVRHDSSLLTRRVRTSGQNYPPCRRVMHHSAPPQAQLCLELDKHYRNFVYVVR